MYVCTYVSLNHFRFYCKQFAKRSLIVSDKCLICGDFPKTKSHNEFVPISFVLYYLKMES